MISTIRNRTDRLIEFYRSDFTPEKESELMREMYPALSCVPRWTTWKWIPKIIRSIWYSTLTENQRHVLRLEQSLKVREIGAVQMNFKGYRLPNRTERRRLK